MPVPKYKKSNAGRPAKFKNAAEMQAAIDYYFEDCKERKAPLTMSGLALALGFESRQSLVDYKSRGDEFSDTIKEARKKVEMSVEERMLSSTGVVAGVIFNAKNNFGWRDKQEIDQTVDQTTTVKIVKYDE